MKFREHAIAGLITGSAVTGASYYFSKNIQVSFMMGVVTLAGSLCPDIDAASIPSRIFAWLGIIFSVYFIYINQAVYGACVGIVYMAFNVDHHRGITHKWSMVVVCLIGMYIYKQAWPGALAVGLCCHYILDKMNPLKPSNWI